MKNNLETIYRHYRAKRSLEFIHQYDAERSWAKLSRKIKRGEIRRKILKISSIAAVLLLIAGIPYMLIRYNYPVQNAAHISDTRSMHTFDETGVKMAVLTLDNGDKINLAEKDVVISDQKSGFTIKNQKDLQLSYKTDAPDYSDTEAPVAKYHTLTVPRGGEYTLLLEDGTEVIMNSESSLYYPVQFTEKQRKVKLSGEAYFKVAKTKDRPFIVEMGDCSVTVLGTDFNLSAYPDRSIYATLVEGKIAVKNQTDSVVLLPNKQAIITNEKQIEVKSVNSNDFISWADGIYQFKDTRLETVLDQLGRWYSVNIEFSDPQIKNKRFSGVILRHEKLSFAIEILEKVSDIQFFREGDVVKVYRKHKINKPL